MSRELLLLRHGEAEHTAPGGRDFERALAEPGRRDVQRMGAWLQSQGLVPDHLLSSPALRARQSATFAAGALGLRGHELHWDERIYGAELASLLAVLADCPREARRVLLVGHNPGLEELLLYLGGSAVRAGEDGRLLTTAACARIELPVLWRALQAGAGRVLFVMRPARLPAP